MGEDEFELEEEEEAAIEEILKRRAPAREPRVQSDALSIKELRAKREVYATLIILALLLGSIYVFWILPGQLGSHPVSVDFGSKK
jgi:hypothetical protein